MGFCVCWHSRWFACLLTGRFSIITLFGCLRLYGSHLLLFTTKKPITCSRCFSFITSQSPIITTIIAVLFLGEQLNAMRCLGFLVSVFGVALIAMGEIGGFKWDMGITYVLLATLAAGCYSVLQKPFLKKYHIIEATTYVIWGGTLFLAIYTPQLQHDLLTASFDATLTVVYLGIFPAAIGYLGWSYVLADIPASKAVSFLYFMPFLATLLGWLCLDEVPVWLSLVGGILAIGGIWLINRSYVPVKIKADVE